MTIYADSIVEGRQKLIDAERNEDGHLRHIHCEGARFHVISYSTEGRRCSEPECEVNFENEEATDATI
jgi:hypothetical protein